VLETVKPGSLEFDYLAQAALVKLHVGEVLEQDVVRLIDGTLELLAGECTGGISSMTGTTLSSRTRIGSFGTINAIGRPFQTFSLDATACRSRRVRTWTY
jgi:hypothetical protein